MGDNNDSSFGPWPQPAPGFFEDAAPVVLNVPKELQRDWNRHVGRRYAKQVLLDTLPSWIWALRNPGLADVSDDRFVEIVCDGIFSKFLTPDLEPPDLERFAPYLGGLEAGERWFKSDFSPMRHVASDADSATTPSVVLYRRASSGQYHLVAIALKDDVFDPTMDGAWTLAKYFALQGAGVLTTLLMHPKLHFPSGAVDAITRTRLADGSVLKQLLLPHFRLAMAVNYAVLYGAGTVLQPGGIYAPYPGSLKEHAEVVATLWRGLDYPDGTPNRAYPRYRFPMEAPVIHSDYGEFLGRYHAALMRFGKVVAHEVQQERAPDVAAWAAHCAEWVPGFPDRELIFEDDNLARVFASLVLDAAVSHSADHYLYAQVDIREVPFRLHTAVPKPDQRQMPDRRHLVETRDLLHYRMCMKMFFQPYVIDRLCDVDYGFRASRLREANERFRADLRETEAQIIQDGIRVYTPLEEMAASVQF